MVRGFGFVADAVERYSHRVTMVDNRVPPLFRNVYGVPRSLIALIDRAPEGCFEVRILLCEPLRRGYALPWVIVSSHKFALFHDGIECPAQVPIIGAEDKPASSAEDIHIPGLPVIVKPQTGAVGTQREEGLRFESRIILAGRCQYGELLM